MINNKKCDACNSGDFCDSCSFFDFSDFLKKIVMSKGTNQSKKGVKNAEPNSTLQIQRLIIKYKIMKQPKTIKIDNSVDGLTYAIIRTYSAGVFAGYIKERNGKEATILNARRLWYWSGAASLSQLAMEGVKKPEDCKFPCEVPVLELTEVVEAIPATEEAKKSINEVKIWEM